ncbi:MAG TPA: lysylphosphatidylglycerol synthase transmembrane domain-containing protein [Terriglobales bacterium]|nr:lysylphosphatidylglycerol synthase transmembrane domain-containing protein [Terriglobales bacterium]
MAADTTASGIDETRPARGRARIVYWVLAIPLAAALVWLSLRSTDWRRVGAVLSSVQLALAGVACAIGSMSYFLRALRWRVLLSHKERLAPATVFWATMAGYLSNNFLPARAGELVRSVMISRRSTLSKTYVLTTALTERVTDAIVLVVASRLLLMGIPQRPAWLEGASTAAFALGLVGVALVVGLRWFHGAIGKVLAALPAPAHVRSRLGSMLEQVVLGFSALDHPARLASFCGLTALIWTADATASMVVARALGLSLPFAVAILLITGLGLGSALPSTPGYVGIYQFVAITVLAPFGFTRDEALAYILVAQAAGYVVITFWGVLGLWRIGSSRRGRR